MFIKKNKIFSKQPQKILHTEKSLLVGQCLQDFYLVKKKVNLIITEENIIVITQENLDELLIVNAI